MKKSNLYAERIFPEHPLALWSFDDEISFFQVFSSQNQNMLLWNTTNIESILYSDSSTSPISEVETYSISLSGSSPLVSSITSAFSINSSTSFNNEKSTACFSTHMYSNGNITKYEIGTVIDSVENLTEYSTPSSGWNYISHTFNIPNVEKEIYFIIKIYSSNTSYDVMANGISLGQWSEEYSYKTVGFNEVDLPESIEPLVENGSQYYATYLDAYGINSENNGYFLVKNKTAYARPSGIPLIYGSYQSLNIEKAPDNNPSIIFPGKGFLNQSGINSNYTLEAWIRLSNLSFDPIRIIGPVASTDGLYVEEGFISVYVGPYTQSYFVGKWDRPMLIHFEYSPSFVTLYVNGERAITMEIDINNISFADKYDGTVDQDWIGIFGSEYVTPFEIDCVSIYPYLVPQETAKKHFVYGQGVQEYQFASSDIFKKTIQFDFPYSEYAFNMIYPDTNKWSAGYSINMSTTSNFLSPAQYTLPEVIAKNGDILVEDSQWYLDNRTLNNNDPQIVPYIKMKPNANYSQSSIYFNNLNMLSDRLYSIFGVFRAPFISAADQELFTFINKKTGESVKIYLDENTLKYSFFNQAGSETIMKQESVSDGDLFNAGINISSLSNEFYSTVGSFFTILDKISLNIGGTSTNVFEGYIYGIHFNNRYFFEKDLSDAFADSFMDINSNLFTYIEYIGNYSLLPIYKNVTMSFDIGTSGYWEDIIPMSMFGKNILNASGEYIYDMDMIQFNINSPYEQIFATEQNPALLYSIFYQILNLYTKDYDYLNSLGYTSYQDITDTFNETYNQIRIDTGLKTYVTLQSSESAGNLLYGSFENIVSASANRLVELTSASATKYEIFDNFIIKPSNNIDFRSSYLGVHIEMKVRGSLTKNMTIRRLELSSFVFNEDNTGSIGTKYSYPIEVRSEAV